MTTLRIVAIVGTVIQFSGLLLWPAGIAISYTRFKILAKLTASVSKLLIALATPVFVWVAIGVAFGNH